MDSVTDQSARVVWLQLLKDVVDKGRHVRPRGKLTRELLNSTIVVDMAYPVANVKERKLGYRFMCAEAAWIMTGDDRVETITAYSKMIANFSDNGITFYGAYGPKFREQLDYVLTSLKKDPNTRQAVFNIWRENPQPTKDYPCTLSCQFMIRHDQLHSFVTMRSNDVWLGTPYDVFNACMWTGYVLIHLRETYPNLRLGKLFHNAASRHIYEENLQAAESILYRKGGEVEPYYEAFNPQVFAQPDDLPEHLWKLARQENDVKYSWLLEAHPNIKPPRVDFPIMSYLPDNIFP